MMCQDLCCSLVLDLTPSIKNASPQGSIPFTGRDGEFDFELARYILVTLPPNVNMLGLHIA